MAKKPFDQFFKPEIESGKYKVVTEHGEPVEIVKWNCKGQYPILAVIDDGDTHDAAFFRGNGEGMGTEDKLFLITDEPEELTEFEKAVEELYESCGVKELRFRDKAKELLFVAREQIIQEYVEAGIKFVNEIYLDQIKKAEYQKGYSKGQEDAEKQYNEATAFHFAPPVQPNAVFYPPCFWGAPCTNPQHDCINCPRQGATGPYSTDTNIK